MIIKHNSVITNRLRELTGLSHYNNAHLRNLLVAKVALEQDNLKAALEILLENQLRDMDVGYTTDDVTKLLNTPLVASEPDTIRDMILTSFPEQPKKPRYLMQELFPQGKDHTAGTVSGLDAHDIQPKNCEILEQFATEWDVYYLVKRENGRLVSLGVHTQLTEVTASVYRTGLQARDQFLSMKRRLNKE